MPGAMQGVGPSAQRLLHSRAVAMAAAAGVTVERLQVLRLQATAAATGPAAAAATAAPAAEAAAEEGQPAATAAARPEAAAREPAQPLAAKPPAKKAKQAKGDKASGAGVGSSEDSEEDRPIKRARVSDGAAKASKKVKTKAGQERASKQQAAASGRDGGSDVDRGVGKGAGAVAVGKAAAAGGAEAARQAAKSEEGAVAAGSSGVDAAARQRGGGAGAGGSSEGSSSGGEDSDVMEVDGGDAATRGKAKQGKQQQQSVPRQQEKLQASAESDSLSDQDQDQREYGSLSPAYDGEEGALDRDRSTPPGRKERAQREGDEAGTSVKGAPVGKGPGASSRERQQQLQQAQREGRLPAPAWKATAAAVRHLEDADRPPYCGEKLPATVVRLSVCMLRQLARDPRSATSLTTTRNSIMQRAALLRWVQGCTLRAVMGRCRRGYC